MLHSYLEQLLISLMLSTSKIPLLPFSTWPFFVTPEIRLLPCPFCGSTFTFVVCGWGTQPLGFLKQGLWLRFCTECVCVCVSLRSLHAGNLMDLKCGMLLTEQKGKRHWLLEQIVSYRTVKLHRQLNKRKTVLKLIYLLCCYVLCSFCGTWLGLMFVLVDLLFCRRLKCIDERKMT